MIITVETLILLLLAAANLAKLPAAIIAALPGLARALAPLLERHAAGEDIGEILKAELPNDAALVADMIEQMTGRKVAL